jgi:hypothetical protein
VCAASCPRGSQTPDGHKASSTAAKWKGSVAAKNSFEFWIAGMPRAENPFRGRDPGLESHPC